MRKTFFPMKARIAVFIAVAAGAGVLAWSSIAVSPTTNRIISTFISAGKPPAQPAPVSDLSARTKELLDLVDQQNPNVALHRLADLMKTDPEVFKNCHEIAHALGHAGYRKYNDFSKALSYQDTVCSDGYLHGVIEQRFLFTAKTTDVIAEMKTVCYGLGSAAGRCFHGVGHGLMYFTSNDLPKSISICETYSGFARNRCYEGVFMENFLSDQRTHISNYLDANNPFFPCQTEPSHLKPYCYFYAPIYYLLLHDNDYASALGWCSSAERGGVIACTRGVGSLALKYDVDGPKRVEAICMHSGPGLVPYCIDGMVSYYLTYWGSLGKARQMCATLDPAHQPACTAAVDRRSHIYID